MRCHSGPLANNNSQNLKHSSKMDLATTTTILKIIFSSQNLRNVSAHFNILVHSRQQQMQQQISTNGECLSSFQCFWISDCFWKSLKSCSKINYWGMSQLISRFLFPLVSSKCNNKKTTNEECLSSLQCFWISDCSWKS